MSEPDHDQPSEASLAPPEPNRCQTCGAAPLAPDRQYCSTDCYRAAEYVCDECGTFTPHPTQHRQRVHDVATPDDERPTAAAADGPTVPTIERTSRYDRDESPGQTLTGAQRTCQTCGEQVSLEYYRLWNVDGELQSCYNCRSRTQRYSNKPVPEGEERAPFERDS